MLFGRRKKGFAKEKAVTEFTEEYNEDEALKKEENEIENQPSERIDLNEFLNEGEETPVVGEEIEQTIEELLIHFIRERSEGAHLTPESLFVEEDPDVVETLRTWVTQDHEHEIKCIEGYADRYYYSSLFMTDNYANIQMLVDEKDLIRTIVQMVRWNAKTYPCPTPDYYFEQSPYFANKQELDQAIDKILTSGDDDDIGIIHTGNHKRYLYSTLHMSEKYARALAEGTEYGEYGYREGQRPK